MLTCHRYVQAHTTLRADIAGKEDRVLQSKWWSKEHKNAQKHRGSDSISHFVGGTEVSGCSTCFRKTIRDNLTRPVLAELSGQCTAKRFGIANSRDKRNTSLTEGADRVSRGHRSCWADRVVKSGQLQIVVVVVEVRVVEGIDLHSKHHICSRPSKCPLGTFARSLFAELTCR